MLETSKPILANLSQKLPPPRQPVLHSDPQTGVNVPQDYVDFLSIYGRGHIFEESSLSTRIYDLRNSEDLTRAAKLMDAMSDDLQESAPFYGYTSAQLQMFPKQNGLLLVAKDDSTLSYFFRTCADPKDWRISIYFRGLSFEETDISFLQFIDDALSRKLKRPFNNGEYMRNNFTPPFLRRLAFCPIDLNPYDDGEKLIWGEPS